MGKRRKRHLVVGLDGDPCPRCDFPTEIRVHVEVTDKHLRQPFYYTRWFYCTNPRCRTRQIMPDRYIVWNERLRRESEQLTPPEGWL